MATAQIKEPVGAGWQVGAGHHRMSGVVAYRDRASARGLIPPREAGRAGVVQPYPLVPLQQLAPRFLAVCPGRLLIAAIAGGRGAPGQG